MFGFAAPALVLLPVVILLFFPCVGVCVCVFSLDVSLHALTRLRCVGRACPGAAVDSYCLLPVSRH